MSTRKAVFALAGGEALFRAIDGRKNGNTRFFKSIHHPKRTQATTGESVSFEANCVLD
jgi:hypothetical protein